MFRKIQKSTTVLRLLRWVMGSVTAFGASFEETLREAQNGDATAQNNLGVVYYEGEGVKWDYAEAVKWLTKAAEQGYAQAQFNLGLMYGKGEGVRQNDTEAINWIRKATRNGDKDAQSLLTQIGITW